MFACRAVSGRPAGSRRNLAGEVAESRPDNAKAHFAEQKAEWLAPRLMAFSRLPSLTLILSQSNELERQEHGSR